MTSPHAPASVALRPFAAAHAALRRIGVRIARPAPAQLVLDYEVTGDLSAVRLPDAAPGTAMAGPTDGLWRHTCMEVFVSLPTAGAYLEFNLAPSGRWAAYRFSGYRAEMTPLTGIRPPRIERRTQSNELLVSADVALPAEFGGIGRLRLGVTAVIEDTAGALSYWALSHPGDRPDFHHSDGFGFEI